MVLGNVRFRALDGYSSLERMETTKRPKQSSGLSSGLSYEDE